MREKVVRVLSVAIPIIHAGLLELFAFDSESPLGFAIHSLPSVAIIAALLFSLKDRLGGALSFFLLGSVMTVFFGAWADLAVFSLVTAPLLLESALLLSLHFRKGT